MYPGRSHWKCITAPTGKEELPPTMDPKAGAPGGGQDNAARNPDVTLIVTSREGHGVPNQLRLDRFNRLFDQQRRKYQSSAPLTLLWRESSVPVASRTKWRLCGRRFQWCHDVFIIIRNHYYIISRDHSLQHVSVLHKSKIALIANVLQIPIQ